VELRIGTGGQITTIKILQSSGFPELDTAYINSLKQQRYLPQEFRGNAVEGILEQDYTFSLDE
jgi:TonB family protein